MGNQNFSAQYQKILSHSQPREVRCLGVLLCYNDADILKDVIEHLIINRHDLVIWDHGSTDGTAQVIPQYAQHIVEHRFMPRSVDFYGLYQAMSQNLLDRWVHHYDWISWPDQDEILEGPDRSMSYFRHVQRVWTQGYDWVQFNNVNFWWSESDAAAIESPIRRVRNYALFPDCAARIRAWRASKTNIRVFNHNDIEGLKTPRNFNLRHYPMRSAQQMQRRIALDRSGLQRGNLNYHYNHMASNMQRLIIPNHRLHYDDGVSELELTPKMSWREVYGSA